MIPDNLRPVVLTPDLIAAELALSAEAGWNQVEADWRFMHGAGQGFGLMDADGSLVASGLTVEFDHFAWISMILVTARWRRQGLATVLMQRCIDRIVAAGLIPALDASPQGREVYVKLGFSDAGTLTRLAGDFSRLPGCPDGAIAPLAEADWPDLAAFDAASSGASRQALLRHLHGRLPEAGFVARPNGAIEGYVLGRPGRVFAQIGPLVANDEMIAMSLLRAAGRAVGSLACIDLFDRHEGVRSLLDSGGAKVRTRYIRMIRGPDAVLPSPNGLYAIAGPELG